MRYEFILLFALLHFNIYAQSFYFKNYNAENGLGQSQISVMTQDSLGRLWLGTETGITMFDGQKSRNFSVKDGLSNNHCISIAIDHQSTVWTGTMNGLSAFNGKKFKNYFFGKQSFDNIVTFVKKDFQNTIWCIAGLRVFSLENGKFKNADLPSTQDFFQLVTDKYGHLLALTRSGQLYSCDNNKQWRPLKVFVKGSLEKNIIYAKFDRNNRLWIAMKDGLYRETPQGFEKFGGNQVQQHISGQIINLTFDQQNNPWFSSFAGVFTLQKNKLIKLDKQNGFSNNLVYDFFLDREGIFWIPTVEGDGLFRLDNLETKTFYSINPANKEPINALCIDSNSTVWIATKEKLKKWNEQQGVTTVNVPTTDLGQLRIVFLRAEADKSVWISTPSEGLWQYKQNKLSPLAEVIKAPKIDFITYCAKDQNQRLWIASFRGIFRTENNQISPLNEFNNPSYSLVEIGQDSMLVGTVSGLLLIVNNRNVLKNPPPLLKKSTVTCMLKINRTVWVGTENGLFQYLIDEGKFLFHSHHLPSLLISNLVQLPNEKKLFIGTTKGLAILDLNTNNITNISARIGLPPIGIVLNSMHLDKKRGLLWLGTEEGVFTYEYQSRRFSTPLNKVILTSVLCNDTILKPGQWNKGVSNWYNIPTALKVPTGKSRLSFEFKAISLRDNTGIQYQYRVKGLNNTWSRFNKNQKLEFPALGPGSYVLEVRAKSRDDQFAKQSLSYSFIVSPRFYQTLWFKTIIILLALMAGAVIQYSINKIRIKAKLRMELARKEERELVRVRTAEDFHDELGNKLTRISLFADILLAKVNPLDQEVSKLVKQIKENTVQLFQGARDIIWSLNPDSDNLYEVMSRICDFGLELFEDSNTQFIYFGVDELKNNLYIPLEYSRNVTMILKETLTNTFKHAKASKVTLSIEQYEAQHWLIRITDDGIGYDIKTVERGHGIDNMNNRVKRVKATLKVASQIGQGSTLELGFKLPLK